MMLEYVGDLCPARMLGVGCEHLAHHRGLHVASFNGEPLWWRGDADQAARRHTLVGEQLLAAMTVLSRPVRVTGT